MGGLICNPRAPAPAGCLTPRAAASKPSLGLTPRAVASKLSLDPARGGFQASRRPTVLARNDVPFLCQSNAAQDIDAAPCIPLPHSTRAPASPFRNDAGACWLAYGSAATWNETEPQRGHKSPCGTAPISSTIDGQADCRVCSFPAAAPRLLVLLLPGCCCCSLLSHASPAVLLPLPSPLLASPLPSCCGCPTPSPASSPATLSHSAAAAGPPLPPSRLPPSSVDILVQGNRAGVMRYNVRSRLL